MYSFTEESESDSSKFSFSICSLIDSSLMAFHKTRHENGLNRENNAFLRTFFLFFGRDNRKTKCSLTRFLDPSHVFSTHSTALQSFRVATSSVPGRYVRSEKCSGSKKVFENKRFSVLSPEKKSAQERLLFCLTQILKIL